MSIELENISIGYQSYTPVCNECGNQLGDWKFIWEFVVVAWKSIPSWILDGVVNLVMDQKHFAVTRLKKKRIDWHILTDKSCEKRSSLLKLDNTSEEHSKSQL